MCHASDALHSNFVDAQHHHHLIIIIIIFLFIADIYATILDVPENLLSEIPAPGKITSKKYIAEIDATQYLLSNGVKLIYKQTELDKNAIIISGFRKGGYYALKEQEYITGLYAAPVIALSGYGDFTRDALSQFLAGNSAKATLLADKTRTGFYASADKRDQKTAFQLLYLKWTAPRMDEKIFEEIKSWRISITWHDDCK